MSGFGNIASAAIVSLCAALAAPTSAQAGFVGGQSWISIRDCSLVPLANGCQDGSPTFLPRPVLRQITGGVGLATDDTGALAGLGSTYGSVQFVGPNALPQLRAAVDTTGNSRNASTNTAVQTFTWTGVSAVDVPLVAALDFTRVAGAAWPDPLVVPDADSLVSDSAVIIAGITLFDPDIIDPASLLIETLGALGLSCATSGVLASGDYRDGSTAAAGTATISLGSTCAGAPLTLMPGDSFGIAMWLQVVGNRGGDIDASHTFTVGFDPSLTADQLALLEGGLRAEAVPEPASLALFGTGLAGLLCARRRR